MKTNKLIIKGDLIMENEILEVMEETMEVGNVSETVALVPKKGNSGLIVLGVGAGVALAVFGYKKFKKWRKAKADNIELGQDDYDDDYEEDDIDEDEE